jgi:hypothetical protein
VIACAVWPIPKYSRSRIPQATKKPSSESGPVGAQPVHHVVACIRGLVGHATLLRAAGAGVVGGARGTARLHTLQRSAANSSTEVVSGVPVREGHVHRLAA